MREKKVFFNNQICALRTRGFTVKRKLSSKTNSKLPFYKNQKFATFGSIEVAMIKLFYN